MWERLLGKRGVFLVIALVALIGLFAWARGLSSNMKKFKSSECLDAGGFVANTTNKDFGCKKKLGTVTDTKFPALCCTYK